MNSIFKKIDLFLTRLIEPASEFLDGKEKEVKLDNTCKDIKLVCEELIKGEILFPKTSNKATLNLNEIIKPANTLNRLSEEVERLISENSVLKEKIVQLEAEKETSKKLAQELGSVIFERLLFK
jgi:hypothetical protein